MISMYVSIYDISDSTASLDPFRSVSGVLQANLHLQGPNANEAILPDRGCPGRQNHMETPEKHMDSRGMSDVSMVIYDIILIFLYLLMSDDLGLKGLMT